MPAGCTWTSRPSRDVYSDVKEQLQCSPEGWYQTGLPWKGIHPPLPSNKGEACKDTTGAVMAISHCHFLILGFHSREKAEIKIETFY